MAALAILVPILAEIGAPILKKILADKLPGTEAVSGAVVDTIAGKLGVPNTPEAIKDAYTANPKAVTEVVKQLEAENGAELLAEAQKAAGLFEREDAKGGLWSAWRPAMSWLVIILWAWNAMLLGLVNAAFKTAIEPAPFDTLVTFSSLWLIVYGGGHTAKSIFGAKLGGK